MLIRKWRCIGIDNTAEPNSTNTLVAIVEEEILVVLV